MTALLEIVSELAAVCRDAPAELHRAIVRAREEGGYTLEEIGDAAGKSKQRISQIILRERGERT